MRVISGRHAEVMSDQSTGITNEHPTHAVCALCLGGDQILAVHLSYGVQIYLCARHGDKGFLRKDGGRELVRRLSTIWLASGVLTRTRVKALGAHIRRVRETMIATELPGSHAWKRERNDAERRFAAGESIEHVIRTIRDPAAWGERQPPSVRTIRRWYADGRWLAPTKPAHPKFAVVGAVALQALRIAMEIGSIHAWYDWISLHGGPSPGKQRFKERIQR